MEFIASPDKYEKFQNVKAKIISHIAKNIHQIHKMSEEFKYYSSGNNGDGLRTQIFHKGKKIEELIDKNNRKELFEKLHNYIFVCVTDLLENYNRNWVFIERFREDKRRIAEKNKNEIITDNYSSTIVLIDGEFLSSSIIEFQEMYSQIYPHKELNTFNLGKFCYETLLNTERWEEQKIFGFIVFYSSITKLPFTNETINEMNGKSLKINATEIEFHSFRFESDEKLFHAINKIMNELNQNRKVIIDKRSVFKNIVFFGDNKHYEITLKNINEKGSKDIVLIRNTYNSEMELEIKYFDIGKLIGKTLGLKSHEL